MALGALSKQPPRVPGSAAIVADRLRLNRQNNLNCQSGYVNLGIKLMVGASLHNHSGDRSRSTTLEAAWSQ